MSLLNTTIIILVIITIYVVAVLCDRRNRNRISDTNPQKVGFSECTSDAQCEGTMICNNGSCVETLQPIEPEPEPEPEPTVSCNCDYFDPITPITNAVNQKFMTKGYHDGLLYSLEYANPTWSITRRLKDGSIDASFGTSGNLVLEAPPGGFLRSNLAVLADGGFGVISSGAVVLKYTSAGLIDPSFPAFQLPLHGQGLFLSDGFWISASKNQASTFYACYITYDSYPTLNYTQHIYKFIATGMDTSYGNQGSGHSQFRFGFDFTGSTTGNSFVDLEYMETTSDEGLILFQGVNNPADGNTGRPLVTKIDPNGDVDLTFGTNGHFWAIDIPITAGGPYNPRGAIGEDGSIYWGGWSSDGQTGQEDSVVLKVLSDGTLDTSWATGGYWIQSGPPGDMYYELEAIAVEPCGNLIIAITNYSTTTDLHIWKLDVDGQALLSYPRIYSGNNQQNPHQLQVTGGEAFGDPIYLNSGLYVSSVINLWTIPCNEVV